jgi:hypothetical protein
MRLKIKESDLVDGIVDGLLYKGRLVMRCQQHDARRAGSDKGLPDLFVFDENKRAWIGLEVKTPTGSVKPEQAHLADRGAVHIVRSIEEAFRVCKETLD